MYHDFKCSIRSGLEKVIYLEEFIFSEHFNLFLTETVIYFEMNIYLPFKLTLVLLELMV